MYILIPLDCSFRMESVSFFLTRFERREKPDLFLCCVLSKFHTIDLTFNLNMHRFNHEHVVCSFVSNYLVVNFLLSSIVTINRL